MIRFPNVNTNKQWVSHGFEVVQDFVHPQQYCLIFSSRDPPPIRCNLQVAPRLPQHLAGCETGYPKSRKGAPQKRQIPTLHKNLGPSKRPFQIQDLPIWTPMESPMMVKGATHQTQAQSIPPPYLHHKGISCSRAGLPTSPFSCRAPLSGC